MRNFVAVSAAMVAGLSGAVADMGTGIKFTGIPSSGTYQKVQSFSSANNCPMAPYSYTGSVSPLDEELSLVFRGPLELKQVAVYTQSGASSKAKRSEGNAHERRHGHKHFHERNKERRDRKAAVEARAVGDLVTATIDGKIAVWTNTYSGATPAPAAPAAGNAAPAPAPAAPAADAKPVAAMGSVVALPSAAPSAAPTTPVTGSAWGRVAYYDAVNTTADGLSFLANNNFVMGLGNVLGFAAPNPNNLAKSAKSAILENTLIEDNNEIVISSDKLCSSDNGCGAVNPGATDTAHHGFSGANKAFFAEYSMPLSGKQGPGTYPNLNPDAPAFWILNTQVVNQQQYGACSCWESGCGEFDVHEVLTPGANQGFSSMHMGINYHGQAPQGINRPTSGTHKIAAVITGENAYVQVLPDDFSFDSELSSDVINGLINHSNVQDFAVVGGAI